ncbi:lysylphosphatidylglycerol synthase domain-containing protein [Halomarina ordinaria]|uniref:Lysylphosphatidylglycerol synthase domain-containing protein n=1 Tax=Halomarina ordinaria TaxID=3033939 RepID=A0ABD5U9B4_9EURY|nr:lysylphosphatidylglycerol synthase domain-containing protein [Halomarina sp. PSRA2]
MRRTVRLAVGLVLGGGALAAYLLLVGPERVLGRAAAVAPWAVGVVLALVVAEAAVDGVGVWASVKPLGDGLTAGRSVQFAFAGDFFDTLSPAGPVSSEPIMARFFSVATATTYSEALGVRGVAKYVKSGAQLFVSTALVGALVAGGGTPRSVGVTLGGAAVLLVLVGGVLVYTRDLLSGSLVVALTPVVSQLSALLSDASHGRETVAAALDRFWMRVLHFRGEPGLLGLIALGGVLEQVLTAGALWVALAGTGTPVALVPIVAVIPLPRAASVLPVPGSLGAYDALLGGALALMTGATAAGAAAAVLIVRTFELGLSLGAGGVATSFLRGWRP